MKKQILSLMLSAAIFTTNPLFAMDQEENLFRSKGSIFSNKIGIDIENCFCIQRGWWFFDSKK